MGRTKQRLRNGEVTLGGWLMIGHLSVVELMAGEGFDWIGVDMEHTSIDVRAFHVRQLPGDNLPAPRRPSVVRFGGVGRPAPSAWFHGDTTHRAHGVLSGP